MVKGECCFSVLRPGYTALPFLLSLLLYTTGAAAAPEGAFRLPAARMVTWQGRVGVLHDIPHRSEICATLSPSGGDDTAQLQGAVERCAAGTVLELKGGTFTLSRLVTVHKGVVLRGAGMGKTVLKGAPGHAGDQLVVVEPRNWSYNLTRPPALSLAEGYRKGSTVVQTIQPHRLRGGDVVLIDQLKDPDAIPVVDSKGDGGVCSWCGREEGKRPLGQLVMVRGAPGPTTIELEIPLYWDFKKELLPQVVQVADQVEGFGMEDLTLDNGASGAREAALQMNNANNSWLLRVEMIGSHKELFRLWNGYRITVRGCRFHEGVPVGATTGEPFGPNRGYGIWINPGGSASLFEDNDFYHLALGITANGTVSGNVIAYNYIHDLYHLSSAAAGAAISFHGAHPMMNLVEGNYLEGSVVADNYWGSSSDNTIFRNRVINEKGYTCQAWAVNLHAHQQRYNVVGNVLGGGGGEGRYERERSDCTSAIYNFGDPVAKSSVVRHGNWDSVHRQALWHGTEEHRLPPSLYLSGPPSWWGEAPWPPIGPDVPASREKRGPAWRHKGRAR